MRRAVASLILMVAPACGGEDEARFQLGDPDPQMAGLWSGSTRGSYGFSSMTMELTADGSFEMNATEGFYAECSPTVGEWGVFEAVFRAQGDPSCGFAKLQFIAPHSLDRLKGDWLNNNGSEGEFEVTKQSP